MTEQEFYVLRMSYETDENTIKEIIEQIPVETMEEEVKKSYDSLVARAARLKKLLDNGPDGPFDIEAFTPLYIPSD